MLSSRGAPPLPGQGTEAVASDKMDCLYSDCLLLKIGAAVGEVNIPSIISVDDHVMEPPDLWTTRFPGDLLTECRILTASSQAASER